MQSLADLNSLSANASIEFTDERTADVIFDRNTPIDQTVGNYAPGANDTLLHNVPAGIEIEEIINYLSNNVTYTIDITSIPGGTVSWSTIPAGCTVTNPSTGVYTISGINSTSIWNAVKSPTITVPNTFTGSSQYTATISYKNGTATKAWYVTHTYTNPTLLYLGVVRGSVTYNEDASVSISNGPLVTDDFYTGTGTYILTITPSATSAVRTLSSAGTGGTSTFNTTTKVLTITGTKTQVNERINAMTMVAGSDYILNFTLTYTLVTPLNNTVSKQQNINIGTVHDEISNIGLTRTYVANRGTAIFASNTPQITDLDTTNPSYTITLTCANGQFANSDTSTLQTNWTYTGSKTSINSLFGQIYFYPTRNFTSNTTVTYTQSKDGVIQNTTTFALNYSSTGQISTTTSSYTSNTTWTPTNEQRLYGTYDILLVGGGGGGQVDAKLVQETPGGIVYSSPASYGWGGGGGAGAVVYSTNRAFQPTGNYTITVGAAGAGAVYKPYYYFDGSPYYNYAANGGFSRLNHAIDGALTANGGSAGNFGTGDITWQPNTPPGNPQIASDNRAGGSGGASGSGYSGGNGITISGVGNYPYGFPSGGTFPRGGGGAGAGGNGTNATSSAPGAGGAGVVNNITGSNVTYGPGGAGGNTASPLTDGADATSYGGGGEGRGTLYGQTVSYTYRAGNGRQGIVIIKVRPL